jgi:hypothetical protein
MKARIWSGVCAATVFGLALAVASAQTPPPTAQSAAKSITVTGCPKKAEAPTGTSGTASRMDTTKFLLTNAAIGTTGTAGTAGATPPSSAVSSEYRIDGEDAKLNPHVGHKVELTGTPEPPPSATQPPAASAANAPKLKVTDVKMVAAACP